MGQLHSTCTAPTDVEAVQRGVVGPEAQVGGAVVGVEHPPRAVAMHVEGYRLLIGRHIHHSAFSLADIHYSQSDEEEVGQ
jgi:hypothetical protein